MDNGESSRESIISSDQEGETEPSQAESGTWAYHTCMSPICLIATSRESAELSVDDPGRVVPHDIDRLQNTEWKDCFQC